MFANLGLLDVIIIFAYFATVFLLAYWVTIKERRAKAENYGSSDYFLGGRNVGWFVIGASLFASNIGSEHLLGLAGSGAKGDFAAGQFELLASLILIFLGWVFVPFYLKSGVYTMPEFLERRFSRGARTYLSVVSIIGYVLTKISLTILAGAIIFEVMGLSFWTGAFVVVVATGLYTVFGGLRAVVYTDMIQMFILVLGSIIITVFGMKVLGGWEGLSLAVAEGAKEQGITSSNFFNLWRPADDPDYPWTGIVFGAPILGIWYWCTDQFIVQRVLSAKDISNARKGTLFGGFLKVLPVVIFVFPGVIAFALSQKGMLDLQGSSDTALPALVTQFMPPGLKGLVLAGLLAALMSSLSSVFNSCSTLFTIDFYKHWRPQSSEKHLVFVGQMATIVLVGLSLLWIPILQTWLEGSSFYKILQSIQAYISPPIAAAFLLGLFVKRLNARGAIWALWTGFALGILRLTYEVMAQNGAINPAPGSFVDYLISVNFLHYAVFLFVVCAAVMVIGSLTAPPHSDEKLKNVVYERAEGSGGFNPTNKDFWPTIILIVIVIAVWIFFSPWGIA